MTRQWDVIVIGAGGSQAQAMLEASRRVGPLDRWLGVDIAWRVEAEAAAQAMGMTTITADLLSDPVALRQLVGSTRLVANLAGPYYRTGLAVLDAAIATETDYLDICDDADVTITMLTREEAAHAAGIRALIGMGSSPGTTNVLIRAAVDFLGHASDVDIQWSVDVADMTDAAARHFWHCFNLVDADGTVHPVASWDDLETKEADFPGTVGRQTVVKLAHPEPITVPRFIAGTRSSNYGTITPRDALVMSWALAFASDAQRTDDAETAIARSVEVFRHYRETRPSAPRSGSGLIIDVHTDGTGVRIQAGADTEMAEATGVPAAAGINLMLAGLMPRAGVLSPELIVPTDFFNALGHVSRGGGGLEVYALENHVQARRIRMRELLGLATAEVTK